MTTIETHRAKVADWREAIKLGTVEARTTGPTAARRCSPLPTYCSLWRAGGLGGLDRHCSAMAAYRWLRYRWISTDTGAKLLKATLEDIRKAMRASAGTPNEVVQVLLELLFENVNMVMEHLDSPTAAGQQAAGGKE